MYKAITKLKSDKKGFTLVELLVTIAVMSIALILITNLMILVIRNYRLVEYRWIAQTMAEYFASEVSSDTGIEALSTADYAEIMYDNPTPDSEHKFTLESCPELGEITYDATNHRLTIVPDEDLKDEIIKQLYIYYITYDEHLYKVHYSDIIDKDSEELQTATIAPISEGINIIGSNEEMGAEVSIDFIIARASGNYDSTTHAEDYDGSTKYVAAGITANIWVKVTNKVQSELTAKSDMNVSVYMNNMEGKRINYIGESGLSNPYVCGWTPNKAGELLDGFPSEAVIDDAGTTAANVAHAANIVRYHSINTPSNFSDTTQSGNTGVNMELPLCFFMATIGNGENSEALKPLREFRDQFLRGNDVGEWIIHEYYYDVSPTLIKWMEVMPELKPVAVFAAKGVSALAKIFVD